MKIYPITPNFKYPDIKKTDYKFGSKTEVPAKVLRPDGNWIDYLPPEEEQNRHGIESSACFIEAQQHAIATIQEEEYGIPDQNYASRFNIQFADPSPEGGSPIDGADSIRHYGLIPESLLPFSEDIQSWLEFCSFKGGNRAECIWAGKMWLAKWDPSYDIVFERHEPIEVKYAKLRRALTYGPICASVTAWFEEDGVFVKPFGMRDNHLVQVVYIDEEGHPYIWDTYKPFLKKLSKHFDFEFAMRWSLDRKKENADTKPALIERFINFLKKLFKSHATYTG